MMKNLILDNVKDGTLNVVFSDNRIEDIDQCGFDKIVETDCSAIQINGGHVAILINYDDNKKYLFDIADKCKRSAIETGATVYLFVFVETDNTSYNERLNEIVHHEVLLAIDCADNVLSIGPVNEVIKSRNNIKFFN